MPYYETVIVLRQDLSTSQAERVFEEAQRIASEGLVSEERAEDRAEDRKGSVSRSESWGLRNLSYPIRKNRKGHYFLFNHESNLKSLAEMSRVLRLNEDVLRLLTLRCDKAISAPSPLARPQAAEASKLPSEPPPKPQPSPSPPNLQPSEQLAREALEKETTS